MSALPKETLDDPDALADHLIHHKIHKQAVDILKEVDTELFEEINSSFEEIDISGSIIQLSESNKGVDDLVGENKSSDEIYDGMEASKGIDVVASINQINEEEGSDSEGFTVNENRKSISERPYDVPDLELLFNLSADKDSYQPESISKYQEPRQNRDDSKTIIESEIPVSPVNANGDSLDNDVECMRRNSFPDLSDLLSSPAIASKHANGFSDSITALEDSTSQLTSIRSSDSDTDNHTQYNSQQKKRSDTLEFEVALPKISSSSSNEDPAPKNKQSLRKIKSDTSKRVQKVASLEVSSSSDEEPPPKIAKKSKIQQKKNHFQKPPRKSVRSTKPKNSYKAPKHHDDLDSESVDESDEFVPVDNESESEEYESESNESTSEKHSRTNKKIIKKLPLPAITREDNGANAQNDKAKNTDVVQKRSMKIEQIVPFSSEGGKHYTKKNFCIMCLDLFDRIDRHFFKDHPENPDVLAASLMKPKSIERRRKLAEIRLKGNDYFNSTPAVNPEGKIIAVRRQRMNIKKIEKKKIIRSLNSSPSVSSKVADISKSLENSMEDMANTVSEAASTEKQTSTEERTITNKEKFESEVQAAVDEAIEKNKPKKQLSILPLRMICPICKGYFARTNLHTHIRLQHGSNHLNTRAILSNSKKEMGLCHERASTQVRNIILPKLRTDIYGIAARYDLVIILYANKFAIRYCDIDQQSYVRGHMRLLAKVLIELRKLNKHITDLIQVFRPLYWTTLLEAIKLVCEHDTEKNRFNIIYNAETLPMLFRKCIKILKNEYSKQENDKKLEKLVKFQNVFEDEVEFKVSYKAIMSRKEHNRHKQEDKIPESDDILTFENFVKLKRDVSLQHFEAGGNDPHHYLNLTQTCAVKIMLYNRRRTGEISKTSILDYLHAKKANPSSEFFQLLSKEEQRQRLKYVRIDIQGKRADGKGSLYITDDDVKCIELIVKNRANFGIKRDNIYLFAVPSPKESSEFRHIKMCDIVAKLSKECSINFKEIDAGTIRGTKLRKQLATYNTTLDHGTNATLLSKHMGHSTKVHHKYYKQVIDEEDVAVTSLLDNLNYGKHKKADAGSTHSNPSKEKVQQNHEKSSENEEEQIEIDSSRKLEDISNNSNLEYAEEESDDDNLCFSLRKVKNKKYPKNLPKKKTGKSSVESRLPWNIEEIRAFNQRFETYLTRGEYPSIEEMRVAIRDEPALANRHVAKLRSRFQYIFKKNEEK